MNTGARMTLSFMWLSFDLRWLGSLLAQRWPSTWRFNDYSIILEHETMTNHAYVWGLHRCIGTYKRCHSYKKVILTTRQQRVANLNFFFHLQKLKMNNWYFVPYYNDNAVEKYKIRLRKIHVNLSSGSSYSWSSTALKAKFHFPPPWLPFSLVLTIFTELFHKKSRLHSISAHRLE